jgi:hypothetical protein
MDISNWRLQQSSGCRHRRHHFLRYLSGLQAFYDEPQKDWQWRQLHQGTRMMLAGPEEHYRQGAERHE